MHTVGHPVYALPASKQIVLNLFTANNNNTLTFTYFRQDGHYGMSCVYVYELSKKITVVIILFAFESANITLCLLYFYNLFVTDAVGSQVYGSVQAVSSVAQVHHLSHVDCRKINRNSKSIFFKSNQIESHFGFSKSSITTCKRRHGLP